MMRLREYYTPEQPPMGGLDLKAEYDRLYLEKCQEVNRLEQSVDSYRNMAEVAIKQKGELRDQLDECKKTIRELENRLDSQKELLYEQREQLEEAEKTIRELAAEQLPFGFIPDVEPPEELPEELAESVPLWASQAVSSQDILCLSSALKNLYEIHKTDSWLLYNRLTKVLEQKIEEYCKEEG